MTTALILFAGTMALSLWASFRVKSVFRRYAEEPALSGLTDDARVVARVIERNPELRS